MNKEIELNPNIVVATLGNCRKNTKADTLILSKNKASRW